MARVELYKKTWNLPALRHSAWRVCPCEEEAKLQKKSWLSTAAHDPFVFLKALILNSTQGEEREARM
jgi:hypothetical protein